MHRAFFGINLNSEKLAPISRFEYLTGLRGIAAIIVLLSHIIQVYWLRYEELPSWIHKTSSISSTFAVKVFFVLSGFLIAHSIEQNVIKNHGFFDIKAYIAARVARIYPPFVYSVAVSIFVFIILYLFNMPGVAYPLKFPGDTYSARDFIALSKTDLLFSLVMLQGLLDINGPLWSLYIEVKLYFIFACVYMLLIGSKRIAAIIGFFLITYFALHFNPEFLRYAVIWLAGSVTYYMFGIRDRRLKSMVMPGCICLITLIICYDILGHFFTLPMVYPETSLILVDLLMSFVISGIILFFRFKLPLAQKAGMLSYSLYATHFPVLLLIQSGSILLGGDSLLKSIMVSFLAIFAALAVGRVGGGVEAKKGMIQAAIVNLLSRVFHSSKSN